MVRITNGFVEVEVTSGAYENIFKGMGYTIVEGAKEASGAINNEANVNTSEDDKFVSELSEKPISEWSKNEVKKFAEIKGIDISKTRSVGEAKEIIKNFMNA